MSSIQFFVVRCRKSILLVTARATYLWRFSSGNSVERKPRGNWLREVHLETAIRMEEEIIVLSSFDSAFVETLL